jgi:hypothetical protein
MYGNLLLALEQFLAPQVIASHAPLVIGEVLPSTTALPALLVRSIHTLNPTLDWLMLCRYALRVLKGNFPILLWLPRALIAPLERML